MALVIHNLHTHTHTQTDTLTYVQAFTVHSLSSTHTHTHSLGAAPDFKLQLAELEANLNLVGITGEVFQTGNHGFSVSACVHVCVCVYGCVWLFRCECFHNH